MSNIEQTLSIIKPDAVERNLQEEIKQEFINKGFEIKKEKKIHISKQEAEQFYKVHETKPFYNELCSYLSSGPIVVMELSRENAVLENRKLMGATNPIGFVAPINFLFSKTAFSLLNSITTIGPEERYEHNSL